MYLKKLMPVLALVLLMLLLAGCSFAVRSGGGGPYHGDGGYEGDDDGHGPPPWAPAHGYRAKHRYKYWPNSEVYHDYDRGMYFYYQNGGWRFGANLPSRITIVGDPVLLEMDDDRPYKWHHKVKGKYPRHKWK